MPRSARAPLTIAVELSAAVLGPLFYALTRWAVASFYSDLGTTPEEAGVDTASVLLAGFTSLVPIVAGSIAGGALCLLVQRLMPANPLRSLPILPVAITPFVAFAILDHFVAGSQYWLWITGTAATSGALLGYSILLLRGTEPSQVLRFQVWCGLAIATSLLLMVLPVATYPSPSHLVQLGRPVSVRPVSFGGAVARVTAVRVTPLGPSTPYLGTGACLMYVGSSDGTSVFIDPISNDTWRLPTASVATRSVEYCPKK